MPSSCRPRSSRLRNRPGIFIQGSAIGFYGARGDEQFDESGPSGTDFLAVVSP